MTYFWLLLALCGLGLVVAGVWLFWPPLALVLAGLGLVAAAIRGDAKWGS